MKKHAKIILSALALVGFQAYGQNLVQNGNFATGDFTDWNLSGNVSWDSISTYAPPGSTYAARFGPDYPPIVMSQTVLGTTIGDDYAFSFYVYDNETSAGSGTVGDSGFEFTASIGGDEVFDSVNLPIPNWTLNSFTVLVTASSETVQFTAVNPPGSYFVGGVSLSDEGPATVPEPSTFGLLGAALAGLAGLRRKLA